MTEQTSPATEVGTFLIRLGNADAKELERASAAVRSDHQAWKDAGRRAAQIVASMDLEEQKTQLWQKARAIVDKKAAQVQPEDLHFARWAAQGVIVGLPRRHARMTQAANAATPHLREARTSRS